MVVPQIDRIWVQYGRQFDELVSYGRLETWIDRHVCGWIPSKPQVFLWEEYVELADGSPDAKRGYNRIQARLSGQDVLSCVLKSCPSCKCSDVLRFFGQRGSLGLVS